MKFKNIINYKPSEGKKFTMPSLTVPDDTMSIRELLSRHANGLPLSNGQPVFYADEDSLGINPKTLDLTEWDDLKKAKDESIKEYKKYQKKLEETEQIEKYKKLAQEQQPEGH